MKKISNIMYKIGTIFDIIGIVLSACAVVMFLILGILCFVLPAAVDAVGEIYPGMDSATSEAIMVGVAAGYCFAMFATMLLVMSFCIVGLIFVKKARRENASFLDHILAGAFGLVSSTFSVVGGVLGAIAYKKAERHGGNNVVDVESKEKAE